MHSIADCVKQKHEVIKCAIEYLWQEGFVQVVTPTMRNASSASFSKIGLKNGGFLRNSMEMPLRYMLKYHDRVFEIGPCMRKETRDKLSTNSHEFTMLEYAAVGQRLGYFLHLTENIMKRLAPDLRVEVYSVADHIKKQLGVDLCVQPDEILEDVLRQKYPCSGDLLPYQVIDSYISRELEPLSCGKCLALVDYPLCTYSSARRKVNSRGIINRFELFVDGIEVANGAEDESDVDTFRTRESANGVMNNDSEIICREITAGHLSPNTGGVGLGIERFCMAVFGIRDIRNYLFASEFAPELG